MAEEKNEQPISTVQKQEIGNGEDELESVFSQEEETKSNIKDDLAFNDDKKRYVKNIGLPSQIRIDNQKTIEWYKEDGIKVRLETLSDKSSLDEAKRMREYGVNLNEGQKAWLYFYNGQFKSIRITFVTDSFKVLSYPHVIDFAIGSNKRDEVKYNILSGKTVPIERGSDLDLLLERFAFLAETDKFGNFDRDDNKYLRQLGEKKDKVVRSVDWKSIETVDQSAFKKHSTAKPVELERANDSDSDELRRD
jgi:hypothetical protein